MMKTISAEGNCDYMDRALREKLGMVVFIAAIILMLVNPLRVTNFNIEDADVSTYIIAPMLMIPVLAYFTFKNGITPEAGAVDIALGCAALLAFVLLTLYLQFLLSYKFMSYRIDMLIFPLAIFGLATLLFGLKNIQKFRALILYPLFASTFLAPVLLNINAGFATLNSVFVYNILHSLTSQVTYIPPITIHAGLYSIGIGTSCAGIAVFLALVLFMLPIAYYADGKLKDKLFWIVSGLLLLLLLNFLRMASIAFVWLNYGPSGTVSYVHSFVGILIFYVNVLAMMLLLPKYGLSFSKAAKPVRTGKGAAGDNGLMFLSCLLAVVFAVIYFAVSLNYLSLLNISPTILRRASGTIFRPDISSGLREVTLPPR